MANKMIEGLNIPRIEVDPVTLQVLGVENYGIINVVSGFVSMFSLLSGSLTSACQRFITFELGKEDGNVSKVFSASFCFRLIAFSICFMKPSNLK